MKNKIKECPLGTSQEQYNRFYLAKKELKDTAFDIGQHFTYEINQETKVIRIIPETEDSKLPYRGTVCRQPVKGGYVPLIAIRGKKIEEFAGKAKRVNVTIFEDEIIVTPILVESKVEVIKNGFTSILKNVISFEAIVEKYQQKIIFSKKSLKKVANDQLTLFDLGYTLSEDSITQTLAQTEQFQQDLPHLIKTLRVVEAFVGIGSQRMALRNLGVNYEVVAIIEDNKHALQSYKAIHGDCPNLGDITKVKVEEVPDHDLLTYSPPCTDISVEGKQQGLVKGSGTRSSLIWECERIIRAKKPRYLLLENVKNLTSKKHIQEFRKWIDFLSSLGYANYWKVLNSADFGIPQGRERVFMVSILGPHSPYEFPKGEPLTVTANDFLESEVDESYYIKPYDWMLDVDDPKILNVPQATKKGYIPLHVPGICDLSRMNSKNRRGRVQKDGKITPTLTASAQDVCYVDYIESENRFRARRLTPKEKWRLFGFKDEDYEKARKSGVSLAQLSKQAGNSIVVKVLEKIFYQLFKGTSFMPC